MSFKEACAMMAQEDNNEVFIDVDEVRRGFEEMYENKNNVGILDRKTNELALIAVLSATGVIDGVENHAKIAKEMGITRAELESAVLIGLPIVGAPLSEAYKTALHSYDES